MLKETKFSIGIPAYKAKFLKECIESILAQSYVNFELIIVNDASPENIDNIVARFLNDTRISYYKNEKNFGAEKVVLNWNRCLSHATGDFFILMGDDDRLEIDFLEEFIMLIERYPQLDVYHCRSKIIDEQGKPFLITEPRAEFESVYESIFYRMQGLRTQFISDFVYRLDALKNNNGFFYLPCAWGSDDLTAYVAMAEKGIAHTNKTIFNYRRSKHTISSSGNIDLKLEAINQEEKWLLKFLNANPNNFSDQIFYNEIKKNAHKWLTKKRIYIIAGNKRQQNILRTITDIRNIKKYRFSLNEYFFMIIEIIKQKKMAKS